MVYSELLAGPLGPVLATIGLAMLTNRRSLEAMAGQVPASLPVVFLAGLLLLVAGLSIVRVHNLWVADWRVIVTLAGWFSVFGGLVRMLVPEQSAAQSALADRLHLSQGHRLGLVLSVDHPRRLLALHHRLEAVHDDESRGCHRYVAAGSDSLRLRPSPRRPQTTPVERQRFELRLRRSRRIAR